MTVGHYIYATEFTSVDVPVTFPDALLISKNARGLEECSGEGGTGCISLWSIRVYVK